MCTEVLLAAVEFAPVELIPNATPPNVLIPNLVVPVELIPNVLPPNLVVPVVSIAVVIDSIITVPAACVRHDPNQIVGTGAPNCSAHPEVRIMRCPRTIGRRHHPCVDKDPNAPRCIDHVINI